MATLVSSHVPVLNNTHCRATVVNLMDLLDESVPTSMSSSAAGSVSIIDATTQWPQSFVLVLFSHENSTLIDAGEGCVSQFLMVNTDFAQQLSSKGLTSPYDGQSLTGVATALFFPDVRMEISFGERAMSVAHVELLGGMVHWEVAHRCAARILAAVQALAPEEQRTNIWVDFTGLLAETGVFRDAWWAATTATPGAVALVKKSNGQAPRQPLEPAPRSLAAPYVVKKEDEKNDNSKMETKSTSRGFEKDVDAVANDQHNDNDADEDLPILEVYAQRRARTNKDWSKSVTSTKPVMTSKSEGIHGNSVFDYDDSDDDDDDSDDDDDDDNDDDAPIFEVYARRRERVRRFMLNYRTKSDSENSTQADGNAMNNNAVKPASSSYVSPKRYNGSPGFDNDNNGFACATTVEGIDESEEIERTAKIAHPEKLSDRREDPNIGVLAACSLAKPVQVILREMKGGAKGRKKVEKSDKNISVTSLKSATGLSDSVFMTPPTLPVSTSKQTKEKTPKMSPPKKRARRFKSTSVEPQTPAEEKQTEEKDVYEDSQVISIHKSNQSIRRIIPCSSTTPKLMKSNKNKKSTSPEKVHELTEEEEEVWQHLVQRVRRFMGDPLALNAVEFPKSDVACLFLDVMGHKPSPGSDISIRQLLASWSAFGRHNGPRAVVMITDGGVAFEQAIMSWVRMPWSENALILPLFFISDCLPSCESDSTDAMPMLNANKKNGFRASRGMQDHTSFEIRRLIAFALQFFHIDVRCSACLAVTEPFTLAAAEMGFSVIGNYECITDWVGKSNLGADTKGIVNIEAEREAAFESLCRRSELAQALRDSPRRPEVLIRRVGSIRLGIVRPVVCDAVKLVSTAWRVIQPPTLLRISSSTRARVYSYALDFFTRDVFASAAAMVHSCNADYFSAQNVSTVGYFKYKLTSLLRRHVVVELHLDLQPLILPEDNTVSPHWSSVFKYLSCTCTPRRHERLLRTNTGEKKCRHLAQLFYWFMRSKSSTTAQPTESLVVPSMTAQVPILAEHIQTIHEKLPLDNVVKKFAVPEDEESISVSPRNEIGERELLFRVEKSAWTATEAPNSLQFGASAALPITTANGYSPSGVGEGQPIFEGSVSLSG